MERTGRFLLDTNIMIALFANEAAVQQRLVEASEVFVPSIVVGELYYGAYKSARVTENLARIVLQLADEEKARWVEATKPVIDTWLADSKAKGIDGDALLAEARALIGKEAGEVDEGGRTRIRGPKPAAIEAARLR